MPRGGETKSRKMRKSAYFSEKPGAFREIISRFAQDVPGRLACLRAVGLGKREKGFGPGAGRLLQRAIANQVCQRNFAGDLVADEARKPRGLPFQQHGGKSFVKGRQGHDVHRRQIAFHVRNASREEHRIRQAGILGGLADFVHQIAVPDQKELRVGAEFF